MIARALIAVRRNIVAWLALFVALGGTGMAASHYIITSTHQIKPSVLKQLREARGATGATGTTGPQGKEGPAGHAGSTGLEGRASEKAGPEGKRGAEGAEGKPGSAVAFAEVTASGVVQASPASKGFENAVVEPHGSEGVYCISGLTVSFHNVVVTADDQASELPAFATATLGKSKFVEEEHLCKSPEPQITVETWQLAPNISTKALEAQTVNTPFYIELN